MRDWYEKGCSSKDIQAQTGAFTTITQNDAAFSTLGQTDFNTRFYQTTTIGKPINIVMFSGGVPVARTYNNVTYTLNLWFSDEEIGNLISYGIDGEHYVLNDDGMGEYLPGQDANSCAYHPGSDISNTNFLWRCSSCPPCPLRLTSSSTAIR